MDITVSPDGWLSWPGGTVRCALGRSGISRYKHEGDGATPAGRFPLRRVYYRKDRVDPPITGLCVQAIEADDGWCDDPGHPDYNRPVKLPHPGRHETLWRSDHLYDLVVVVGYNDDPVESGRGSAIFLHVASRKYDPTEGCVAVRLDHLLAILYDCERADLVIAPPDDR